MFVLMFIGVSVHCCYGFLGFIVFVVSFFVVFFSCIFILSYSFGFLLHVYLLLFLFLVKFFHSSCFIVK